MPVFEYTAKRNIEPVDSGYSVTGTDISADTTDDSFNASSSDLSGLSDNDWIKVEGFSNSANNGWHQLNAASTTGKITVDTDLTTESAGNTITITGYKRGSGQAYKLEVEIQQYEEIDDVKKEMNITIGGKPDTLFHNELNRIEITTDYLEFANDRRQWQEFLSSVAGGETFTFDRNGTTATPDDPVNVILDGKWSKDFIANGNLLTYSFTMLKL